MRFKRLTPTATAPEFKTAGAACFDIALDSPNESVAIRPHQSVIVGTGLAFEVPDGHVLQVLVRSGLGFNLRIGLVNDVGIIDSDYRGELKLCLMNRGVITQTLTHGQRIAQGLLLQLAHFRLQEAKELTHTARGAGGFGSTGNQ